MKDYKNDLFAKYSETHVAFLDSDDASKLSWFDNYSARYYLKFIKNYNNDAKILEIGCNKGYLLKVLSQRGYKNLSGIDLSGVDLETAKRLNPEADIQLADANEYLLKNVGKFDVIIIKAVLEHVNKDMVIPLLHKMNDALRPGGVVIIDVPNMDWFFANHERYIDFTHEVGFTKESLSQIMRTVFSKIDMITADNIISNSFTLTLRKKFSRFILGKLLSWADPEGGNNPIWDRSLIGVGMK